MEDLNIEEKYDDELFEEFKNRFSEIPNCKPFFDNEKLYNNWGKKCTFILKMLSKIIINEIKGKEIKKAINFLVEFLSEKKDPNNILQYLSEYNNELEDYQTLLLKLRNLLAGYAFNLIIKYRDSDYNIIGNIKFTVDICLKGNYKFLQDLFELFKFYLNYDDNNNLYLEFLLLLNSDNISKSIINNKNCELNEKQKALLEEKKHE